MNVQLCADGGIPLVEIEPGFDVHEMVSIQHEFQRRLGKWDDRIYVPLPGQRINVLPMYSRQDVVLHSIDMAIQEASEAWDMLEGGWKHHKKNPKMPDINELIMEIVDVIAFSINAFLFSGGRSDRDLFKAQFNVRTGMEIPTTIQDIWKSSVDHAAREAVYGHGDGAHGPDWVKTVAADVNAMRSDLFTLAATIRSARSTSRKMRDPQHFPSSPAAVYLGAVIPAIASASRIPGCDPEVLYCAFHHKVSINNSRQDAGY